MVKELLQNLKGTVFQYRKNVLFYALLVVLMLTLMRPGVNVAYPIRIVIMFLALFPTFSRPEYLPFCMTCIVGISSNAFYHILPTYPSIYLVIILIFYINYKKRSGFFLNAFGIYFAFLVSSLVHGDFPVFLLWGLIAVILSDFIKEEKDLGNLVMAFVLVSFTLSILFLLYKDQFTVDFRTMDENLERAYWTNSNRFGAVIAAGGVLAVAYLTEMIQIARSKFLTVISIATVVLVIPTLGLNASRGATFAFVIPSALLILFSKIRTIDKMLIFVVVTFVLYYLYTQSNVFELITARMQQENVETGGGRTRIWGAKLAMFLKYDIATQFVGIGRRDCLRLAGYISTHNDFVTALIGYGYFGLMLFFFLIIFPFIKATRKMKKTVLCLTAYMIIECMVLEPFFRGYLFFLMFYIFTIKYVLIEKKCDFQKEIISRQAIERMG